MGLLFIGAGAFAILAAAVLVRKQAMTTRSRVGKHGKPSTSTSTSTSTSDSTSTSVSTSISASTSTSISTSISTVIPPTTPAPFDGYTVVDSTLVAADGSTDDAAHIEAEWAALGAGTLLRLPAGNIRLSRHLLLASKSNTGMIGRGKDTSILISDDPANGAVVPYQCDTVLFQDFQVYSPNTTPDPNHLGAGRLDAGDARGVYVTTCNAVTLNRVKVRNIAAAGVAFWNTTNSNILSCEALDTRADSFHITGSSYSILVQYCIARGAGDDSFSCIGYGSENPHDVSFFDNQSYDGWWGSGLGIEGSSSIIARRHKVYRSGAAGIRIASQNPGSYGTGANATIEISDCIMEACVTRAELIDAHGSIMIFSDYLANSALTFLRNSINNGASHTGFKMFGLDATHTSVATANGTVMTNTLGNMIRAFEIGPYATLTKGTGSDVNTFNGAPA